MSERLASVHRSIAREEALRDSGADPGPLAVEGTVSFVCSHQALLADEEVRRYLLARSDTLYYHIATKLLDLVVPLHDRGYEDEAVRCLRNLVRVRDPEVWDPKGNYLYRLLADKAFKEVLGQERLLVDHPRTWGALAIETFSVLLGAPWKASRWEFGAGPDGRERYPAGWFSGQLLESEDARWLAGEAVRKALTLAARRSSGEAFRALVDGLLQIPYTIALNLILQTICDALGESGEPWLVSEAIRFLTLEDGARTASTYESRRMLRRALPVEFISIANRRAILQAIREGQADEFRRCNELSDLESWGVLSADEVSGIAGARASGRLFPPRDPREMPTFIKSEWSEAAGPYPAFVCRWPYPDEHPLLSALQERESRQPNDAPRPFEEDLGPRLQALRAVLAHPESIGDEWLGTTLGYCTHAIEDLIVWYRLSLGPGEENRPLLLAEAMALYEPHVPWWIIVAQAAVTRLRGHLPEGHDTKMTEMLSWGWGDPVYESMRFLDELLVVEPGEPFDSVRQGLELAISDAWTYWPRYTRATALAVLRPFHWATIPGLMWWIDHTLSSEDDPHLLNWCLQTLLRCSNSIADRLRGLIERIATLPSMEELAQKIGQILGDALIRARGNREGWDELEAVADLAGRFMARTGWHDEFRAPLASGMMWGARTRLNQADRLTDQHTRCWLPLARQTLTLWLEVRDGAEDGRIPLHPIISVLGSDWTNRQRAELWHGLTDLLERILLETSSASFFDVHHQLGQQLKGEGTIPARSIPDDVLIRLCHASSRRVAEWAAAKTTSNDLMFSGTVHGREMGELIQLAFRHASDRDLLRRELAPCIDRLHEAGRLDLATELRLILRRG